MKQIINNPFVIVISGIVIGWVFYLGLVSFFECRLENRIKKANWLVQTLEKDPSLSGTIHDETLYKKLFNKDNRDTLAWRILNTINIIEDDAAINDAGIISRSFFADGLDLTNQNDLKNLNSIDILVRLLQFVANGPNYMDVNNSIKEEIAQALATSDIKEYDTYLKNNPIRIDSEYEPNENEVGSEFHSLLNRLFMQFKVDKLFLNLPSDSWKLKNYNEEKNGSEELRQLHELALQILTSIYDDPKVSSEKIWLDNIKGPEQNVMFCMFFVALLILIRKKISKLDALTINEDLSKRLKLYYAWIFASLTAVGFIGTIRGLSQALSSADVIFKSSPGLEQAISISEIAGILGIAFATTLIALVLTLILGLIRLILDPTDQFKIDEA